eukprot:3885087-Pleurochrysis_carterae.AAC.1
MPALAPHSVCGTCVVHMRACTREHAHACQSRRAACMQRGVHVRVSTRAHIGTHSEEDDEPGQRASGEVSSLSFCVAFVTALYAVLSLLPSPQPILNASLEPTFCPSV